jgi:hypothetical protein
MSRYSFSRCAVISNGDFEEYWRFHLAHEHQRLYPARHRASTCSGLSAAREY